MDKVVPQVLEEKLDGHLQEMAEEEGVAEIRELATLLPATELRRGGVSEQCRQLLARDTPFRARDPQTRGDSGGQQAHSEEGSTLVSISLQLTEQRHDPQDGKYCGRPQDRHDGTQKTPR